eukprot:1159611-Pelagomonas_calceolata.AAC.7
MLVKCNLLGGLASWELVMTWVLGLLELETWGGPWRLELSCLMDWSACKAYKITTNIKLCLQQRAFSAKAQHNAAFIKIALLKKGDFPHSIEILVLPKREKRPDAQLDFMGFWALASLGVEGAVYLAVFTCRSSVQSVHAMLASHL